VPRFGPVQVLLNVKFGTGRVLCKNRKFFVRFGFGFGSTRIRRFDGSGSVRGFTWFRFRFEFCIFLWPISVLVRFGYFQNAGYSSARSVRIRFYFHL